MSFFSIANQNRRPMTLNLLELATLGLGAWGKAKAATI